MRIKATGLKPNTKHKFFVNKTNFTAQCDTTIEGNVKDVKYDGTEAAWLASIGLNLTDVMTNEKGIVEFDLYLDQTQYKNIELTDANPKDKNVSFFMEIYNTDDSSYAAGKYEMRSSSNQNKTKEGGGGRSDGGGVTSYGKATPGGAAGGHKDSAGNPAKGNWGST